MKIPNLYDTDQLNVVSQSLVSTETLRGFAGEHPVARAMKLPAGITLPTDARKSEQVAAQLAADQTRARNLLQKILDKQTVILLPQKPK